MTLDTQRVESARRDTIIHGETHKQCIPKQRGYWVRGVDIKQPEFTKADADEFELLDLRRCDHCPQATRSIDSVYALAADMGAMEYLPSRQAPIFVRRDDFPAADSQWP